jgi:hypothetical protein
MSLDQRFAGFKAAEAPDLWSEAERRAVSPSIVDLPVHLASRQWGRVIGGVVAAALVAALFLWPFLGLTGMRGEQPVGPIVGPSSGPPSWVGETARLVAISSKDPNPTFAEWVLADAKLIAPAVGLTPDQVSGTEYLVVLHGHFTDAGAKVPAGAPFPTGTLLVFTLDPATHQVKDFGISNTPVTVKGLQPFSLPVVDSPAPASPTNPPTTVGPIAYPIATCMSPQLSMRLGGRVSEATGQHSRVFKLTNTSSTPCHLEGYPNIVLLDKNGNPIPFLYRQGGDQMITSQPPTPVALLPGGSAYLMINKYRCDLADITLVGSVKVTPPGSAPAISMKLELLSYCGPGDPGSVVSVSPIEPTVKALLAH